MTIVYKARWVLPIEGLPIDNGAIAVDEGRLVDVGKARAISAGTIHDLGDCILLPGFVNAHTHLELSCYRGMVPPMPLWEWFERLMTLIYGPGGPKPGQESVLAGAAESLAAGVTCVGDISRTGVHIATLRSSPIRKVCFLELISGAMQPPNDAASLAAMLDQAMTACQPDVLRLGVSPHTLYTVTWSDLCKAGDLARERRVPLTIHLAETSDEVEWLVHGTGPLADMLSKWKLPCASSSIRGSAIELLKMAGLLRLKPLLAHVNYISSREVASLAASQATVVWCPRSHRFFGHEPHRWQKMLAAGINVCIGTDSLASNETLSILDELRFVRRSVPAAEPDLLLEMGTIRGAKGLGLDARIGTLQLGKWADFAVVPWDAHGPRLPAANLLDGNQCVTRVWIGGDEIRRP
ncbi:MAG TPA: amidohydrolase family protein [Phycisphaerae bacterium]|nr:amidohydrolase family protein [Phycisphaerae bacterium]